jgi:hypothetical protein
MHQLENVIATESFSLGLTRFNIISLVLSNLDQKHLESFEMWCWRKMEKISWTHHVRNEDVLPRVKEQRNLFI